MSVEIEKELSNQVLGAAFAVHNSHGPGLLESAYEGALVIEFKHMGFQISRQHVYPVYYRGDYRRICSSMSAPVFVHPCTAGQRLYCRHGCR